MSPLAHPFRIVRRYLLTAVFWAALALACLWDRPAFFAYGEGGFTAAGAGGAVCLAATILWLAVALTGAVQLFPLLRYRGRPEALLDQLNKDLDSPRKWKRCRALQAIADYHGQPFGVVACWPVWWGNSAQLRNMILLYKEWSQVAGGVASGEALDPHILHRLYTPAKVVLREMYCDEDSRLREPPLIRRPPPVSAEDLQRAMRGEVDSALRRTAEALNGAPPGRLLAAAEERIRDVLGDLLWAALTTGLRLRMEAAMGANADRRQAPGPLGRPVEASLNRAADAVKDAILDAGIPDDEPAPDPARRLLPPLHPARFAAALREQVERTLAAVADRVNAAPDLESMASGDEDIRDLFEALAGRALETAAGLRVDAAAERLPWPAARGAWAKKFRRMTAMESLPADPDGRDATAI